MAEKQRSVVRHAQRAASQDTKLRAQVLKGMEDQQLSAVTMDSFVNFAAKLGVGADNVMSGSNYAFNPITRNRILLEWIYRGSWIAGLAVDLVADDMTRAGIEFKTNLAPEDSQRIEEMATELDLWGKLNETIKWGRLYGGSIAVLMIDGQDLRTPLNLNSIGQNQFKGLAVFDRWMLEPSLEDLVTEFNQYTGTPRFYRVLSNAPMMQGKTIHYSRVMVRSGGIKLPYQQALIENLWDLSIIERIYDRLISFDSASTGAAQLVYKSYLRTLKVKGLREIVSAGQNNKAYKGLVEYVNMMSKYAGIEGVTLVDGEDEYDSEHHGAFSGLAEMLLQFGQQLSGALQIPLVRLFGQSPAGLNSTGESDIRTYYDHVKQQQIKVMKVGVTKTYRVLAASLGIKLPDDFRIDFKSLWELNDEDKAGVAKNTVDAVMAAWEAKLISDRVAMKELRQSSDLTGIFTNISDADIEAAQNFTEAPGLDDVMTQFGLGGAPNVKQSFPAIPNGSQQAPNGERRQLPKMDSSSPGGSQLQLGFEKPSAPSGPDNQGAQPRRHFNIEPEATSNPDLVRRRPASLGGISGGANASGRF